MAALVGAIADANTAASVATALSVFIISDESGTVFALAMALLVVHATPFP
jgi:hypothetical protein